MSEREAKIKWFCLRTGASEEDAKKFLENAKWKIDNAVAERRQYYETKNKSGIDE